MWEDLIAATDLDDSQVGTSLRRRPSVGGIDALHVSLASG